MQNQIEIYKAKYNQTEIEEKFEAETVWLGQKQLAGLFEKVSETSWLHLKNIIYQFRQRAIWYIKSYLLLVKLAA